MRDPERPPLKVTVPVKVEPERVATTESFTARERGPDVPPPVRPRPAVIAVMSPTVPSFTMVMAPFDPVVMEMPAPATRYEDPSINRVRDPESAVP